jgi:hypothetical protein
MISLLILTIYSIVRSATPDYQHNVQLIFSLTDRSNRSGLALLRLMDKTVESNLPASSKKGIEPGELPHQVSEALADGTAIDLHQALVIGIFSDLNTDDLDAHSSDFLFNTSVRLAESLLVSPYLSRSSWFA